ARADVLSALKAGGREGSVHRARLRTGLLVMQSALAVVLCVGTGLFVRSLHNVRGQDLGYDAHHVLHVRVGWSGSNVPDSMRPPVIVRVVARTAARPRRRSDARPG